MKELINKYEGKELIRQVRGMCGVSEKEALNDISAAKELKSLETDINFQKLQNKAKILKPTLLMEIAKCKPEQKSEILEKIAKEELTSVNDVKNFRLGIENNVFQPKLFTVWNFNGCDTRYGIPDFPGRVPGQIIENILYYYTYENDLVVDPMAGSGTTYDVAMQMKRVCLCYDLQPIRPEIKQHDIREGFPEETKGCSLIFLDPPYYKKLANKERYNLPYIKNRDAWLAFMEKLVVNCSSTLSQKGIVALLISDFIDEEEQESLLTCEYYNMFRKSHFNIVNRIQVPLTTDQYSRHEVDRAKEGKTLLNISRDLYIFRKL